MLAAPFSRLCLCWAAIALLTIAEDAKVHSEASVARLEKKHLGATRIGKTHDVTLKQAWSASSDGFPEGDSSSGDTGGMMPQEDSADGLGSDPNNSVPVNEEETVIDDVNIKPDPGTDDAVENLDFPLARKRK